MKTITINNISGVIFDMDGVIFDSESLWKQAFLSANEKFGLDFTEEYRQSCCGKDEASIRRELRLLHPRLDADEYRDFIVEHVHAAIANNGAPLKPRFFELVNYLKSSGKKIALATSSKKSRAMTLFDKRGMDAASIFDGMVFAEDVAVSKPNPEIFLTAAKKIDCSPSSCIVLEDSLNGIVAANAGGFLPVMVIDLIPPDAFARQECVFIANDLLEVTNFFSKE